jgi:hypothetical protein
LNREIRRSDPELSFFNKGIAKETEPTDNNPRVRLEECFNYYGICRLRGIETLVKNATNADLSLT